MPESNVPMRTEMAVLAILKQKPDSSRVEIADKISKTVRTVQRALDSLRVKGYIRRVGSKQNSIWEVLKWNHAIKVNQNWIGRPVLFWCREGGGHLYSVSNAFFTAVKANTRKYYWIDKITKTAGTVYNFDQENMVKGSGISQAGAAEARRSSLERCMPLRWGFRFFPRSSFKEALR